MEGEEINSQNEVQEVGSTVETLPNKSYKKLFFVIGLIFILLIGGGYAFYSITYFPRVIEESSEVVLSCVDSDGNNIYEKGWTDYEREEPGETSLYGSEDVCDYYHEKSKEGVGLVRETYCEEGMFVEIKSTCGKGYVCRNGACMEGDASLGICVDTDGGKDSYKRGEIEGIGGTGEDTCWVATSEGSIEGGYTSECGEEFDFANRCYVYEYFCSDPDTKGYEILKCENGCNEGACF
jgi:hypothetical protein